MLVVSPKVGGVGVNLTMARYCVIYSQSFDYEEAAQRDDRLHRIGQKHNVTYIKLLMRHTIDVRVNNALKDKLQEGWQYD